MKPGLDDLTLAKLHFSDIEPIFPRTPFRNKDPSPNNGYILAQMQTSLNYFSCLPIFPFSL